MQRKLGWWALTLGVWGLSLTAESRFPLHTAGRHIRDAQGNPFLLKAVNWYGANLEGQVVQGLDQQPIDKIISLIEEWGFNAVRLPFSNAMLHDSRPVDPTRVRANPEFQGRSALEVFDATVGALARRGIAVILNNHSTTSEWCCGYDANGLWYYEPQNGYRQTLAQFADDWKMLAARYENIPEVVAADLRNEVRTAKWGHSLHPRSPNWGKGNDNDWRQVAEWTGNQVLEVNPNWLIIVEGINWQGALSFLGGWRPQLRSVSERPISLIRPDKLVYAVHNYGYTGPEHNGDPKTSPGKTTYREMDEATFFRAMEEEWAYILNEGTYYQAPIIVSEFGAGADNPSPSDKVWFERLTRLLMERDVSFAYWPLNQEGYGLVNSDYSRILSGDWREPHLRRILDHTVLAPPPSARIYALNLQQGDARLSSAYSDWLPGATKGICAVGTRLAGLSQDYRAVCLDHGMPDVWTDIADISVEAVEESPVRSHTHSDWAYGYTKYECPAGMIAIGVTKHAWGTSGLLCARAMKSVGNDCRTLWFNRGDARASATGGDFASGSYKGQCANQEYLAGIAQRKGRASALLCCLGGTQGLDIFR